MELVDPEKEAKTAKTAKAPRAGKLIKMARATKLSDLVNHLTNFEFAIIVEQNWWEFLTFDQQEALVDHELCHCGFDEKGPYIKDHTVEDFVEIVKRHGLWSNGLIELGEQVKQLDLFPAAPEVDQPALQLGLRSGGA